MTRCSLCGHVIENPREAWREARGWVNPHGAKAMTGMHQTGKLAHPECIVRLRLKLSPQQETLLAGEEGIDAR